MKEKILEEFIPYKDIRIFLGKVKRNELSIDEVVYCLGNIMEKSNKEYADWKIKECIKEIEDDIDYEGEIYSTEYRNGQERAIAILSNKDKIK